MAALGCVDRRKLGTPMEFFLFSFSKERGIFWLRGFSGILDLCENRRWKMDNEITLASFLSRFIFLFVSCRDWWNGIVLVFVFEEMFRDFLGKLGDTGSLCSSIRRKFYEERWINIVDFLHVFFIFLFLFLYSLFIVSHLFSRSSCCAIVGGSLFWRNNFLEF